MSTNRNGIIQPIKLCLTHETRASSALSAGVQQAEHDSVRESSRAFTNRRTGLNRLPFPGFQALFGFREKIPGLLRYCSAQKLLRLNIVRIGGYEKFRSWNMRAILSGGYGHNRVGE